jgi:hypothetical protein
MAYNRQPQTVLAGTALKQNPPPSIVQPAGIIPVTLDADIATTTSLGVVQVGAGLSITPSGILSATGGSSSLINVKLTSIDYTATAADYYIGATKKEIDITLPLGTTGKVYVIKNQVSGNIKVKTTGSQKIDTASDRTLGTDDSLAVVFDGTRWNVIE